MILKRYGKDCASKGYLGGGKQEVRVTHVHQQVQVNDGGQALVALAPAECIAVAGELIQAARRRMDRATWPPRATDNPDCERKATE